MLRNLGFFLGRLALRFVGVALVIVGASISIVSGGNLYMVATGQVRPGEPIYPDALAMPLGNSIGGLLVGIILLTAGYWLFKLAIKLQFKA